MFSRLPDALPATSPGRSIASLWKTAVIFAAVHDEHLLMLNCLPDVLSAASPGRSIASLWKTAAILQQYNNEHVFMFSYFSRCTTCNISGQIHRLVLEDSRHCAAVQ